MGPCCEKSQNYTNNNSGEKKPRIPKSVQVQTDAGDLCNNMNTIKNMSLGLIFFIFIIFYNLRTHAFSLC